MLSGLLITAIFAIPWLLAWNSKYWKKYPLQYLSIEVVPVRIGNVKLPRENFFEIQASYSFEVEGTLKWGYFVSFSSSRFRTENVANQYVKNIQTANIAYYSSLLNLACLLPGGNINYFGGIFGVVITFIGFLIFRSHKKVRT
jgi:hypothetical protein